MDSNYEVDSVISGLKGQTMALFNAVVVLIEMQSDPDEFALRYRKRLADLSRGLESLRELAHAHGRAYTTADHERTRTAIREMSEVLLRHADNRGTQDTSTGARDA